MDEIKTCWPHGRRRRTHQRLQIVEQPGTRPIASAHIGDEGHCTISAARSDQGGDVAHERVLAKRGFHPVEFDAGASDLDLPVQAAEPL